MMGSPQKWSFWNIRQLEEDTFIRKMNRFYILLWVKGTPAFFSSISKIRASKKTLGHQNRWDINLSCSSISGKLLKKVSDQAVSMSLLNKTLRWIIVALRLPLDISCSYMSNASHSTWSFSSFPSAHFLIWKDLSKAQDDAVFKCWKDLFPFSICTCSGKWHICS